jgi:YfiH family protein
MERITPDWLAPSNVAAFATTRQGGVSSAPYDDGRGGGGLNLGIHVGDDPLAVAGNRALLRQSLPSEPVWLTQVHGINVVDAGSAAPPVEADASIATTAGAVCVIQTADCLPVLFCDVEGKAVAAAHAGWRGLAGGVLQQTVARMRAAGSAEILAWLGPAIGPQAFEVGQDVWQAFVGQDAEAASAFTPLAARPGKYLADIYALARQVLGRAGVKNVSGGGFCTVGDARRFYSYRRDGVTGRMASLIWLK